MTDYPVSVYQVFHPDPFHIPTRDELEAFQIAAAHHWAVDAIMRGVPLPWPSRLELTRYPEPLERVLRLVRRAWTTELTERQERIVVAAWWDRRQLEEHAYPGQPAHHSTPVLAPCTCRYWTWGASWTWTREHGAQRVTLAYGSGFQIHPGCPHHGTPVPTFSHARMTVPRWMVEDYPGSIL